MQILFLLKLFFSVVFFLEGAYVHNLLLHINTKTVDSAYLLKLLLAHFCVVITAENKWENALLVLLIEVSQRF